MVKSTIISATKANSLFWLGRYEERVYLTLHQLRKCYDKMIDGEADEYRHFWDKFDVMDIYQTNEDFTLGMMYDKENACSVMSAQTRAMDNAILVREDITSETLSYIEMSVALMKECSKTKDVSLISLQPVIDWSLAFWGSAEQRLQNHKVLYLMMIGRNLENLDMQIRFGYDYDRVSLSYASLKRYCRHMADLLDDNIENQLNSLLIQERFNLDDPEYKNKLLAYINQLVRV